MIVMHSKVVLQTEPAHLDDIFLYAYITDSYLMTLYTGNSACYRIHRGTSSECILRVTTCATTPF